MSKGALIFTGILGTALFLVGSKLAAKKHAAEKLTIAFKKLQIRKATFSEGISFRVFISAINPTPTPLSFTSPFIQIFLKDTNGELNNIASSNDAKDTLYITGRQKNELFVDLNLPLLQALKLPKLLTYLVTQALDKEAKKTKKIIIEYSTKAEGINLSDKTEVLI